MRTSQSGRWVTAELMDHLSSLLSSPTAGRHCWLRIIHYDGFLRRSVPLRILRFSYKNRLVWKFLLLTRPLANMGQYFEKEHFWGQTIGCNCHIFQIIRYTDVYFNMYFIVHFSDIMYSWYTFSVHHNHRQSIELRIINVKLVHSTHCYETDTGDSCNIHFWQTLRHCIWQ